MDVFRPSHSSLSKGYKGWELERRITGDDDWYQATKDGRIIIGHSYADLKRKIDAR